MPKTTHLIILVLVLSTFFLLIVTLSFLLFVILFGTSIESKTHSREYRYTEFDSNSRTLTSQGLVKLNRNLPEEEYITYTNEETGNQVFISHFNNKEVESEYKCTGKCLCRPKKSRRTAAALVRPLYIVVSALSVAMAKNVAELLFDDECDHSSECKEGEFDHLDDDVLDTIKEYEEEVVLVEDCQNINTDSGRGQWAQYKCNAHCWDAADVDDGKSIGFCESIKSEGIVKVWDYIGSDPSLSLNRAKDLFIDERMIKFCIKFSTWRDVTDESSPIERFVCVGKREEGDIQARDNVMCYRFA